MPRAFREAPGRLAAAVLAAGLAASGCAALLPATDPRAMRFPPPAFSPPSPARHVLPNGLTVFLLEDHEIPLIQGQALVRTGWVFDPPGKTGLSRLCGQILVSGGTRDKPGGSLDEILEERAIDLSGEIGSQSGSVGVNALTTEADAALALFADVLRRPAFDAGRLDIAKKRLVDEIRRLPDKPEGLAFREFRRLLYGADPRGRYPTEEEVSGLSRQDVVDFHRRYFHPDRVILGFSGDFEAAALLARIEALFGDWAPSGEPPPAMPVPDGRGADAGISLVDKDLPQATIALGHLAPSKTDDDYVTFMLANYVLGEGGFNSRLTREIRSNRGLAYSVGSFYRGDVGYGVFVASCQTKNETAPEALGLIIGLADELGKKGVTAEELAWAKESIINGMIFRYSSSAAVMGEALSLEYDRLPPDFYRVFKGRIEAAGLEDVNRAAARRLDPGRATIVVLGKESAYAGAWPSGRTLRHLALQPDGRVR